MKITLNSVIYLGVIVLLAFFYFSGNLDHALDRFAKRRALLNAQVTAKSYENSWLGVRVQQFPEDLILYSELIYKLKPDVVVETGTFYGGSAVFFATVEREVNPQGKVITIDIADEWWRETVAAGKIPEDLKGLIRFIKGSSTSAEVLKEVGEETAGKKVLVFLDSLHTKEYVLEEIRAYAPFVSLGSYLIVSHTHFDLLNTAYEGKGPLAAVEAFMEGNTQFMVDPDLPRFFISACHLGFLRRVK